MSTSPTQEAEPHSARQLYQPLPLKNKLPERHLRNRLRRGSLLNFPDGKKCFTHPSLWWLLGSSLACQEAQEQTYLLMANHNWHVRITPTEAPSPTQELEVAQ